ncbi:MAG: HD domain-containing protein [Hyphomicrobiales bacterium]
MDKHLVLQQVATFVKEKLMGEGTGHDWYHIDRVRQLSLYIAQKEKANLFVVELGALLHDISDWKFNGGDLNESANIADKLLRSLDVLPKDIQSVCNIINEVSFKGAGVEDKPSSLETMIVQDADRLDAIGAIGIARTFAYGGSIKQPIHDPEFTPKLHSSFEEYKNEKTSTISHFYEKLLLLKDRLHTKVGKEIGEQRHQYMLEFLERFYQEWEGKA